jgi:hypothetical protein
LFTDRKSKERQNKIRRSHNLEIKKLPIVATAASTR